MVPEGKELSIVVVVEEVMVCVMGTAINKGLQTFWDAVDPIMYGYRPEVDKHK